jgi:hypothetical protein
MFDIQTLPHLIRQDLEYGESHFPIVQDDVPPVVAADPSWTRQWRKAKAQLQHPERLSMDDWSAKRKARLGEFLAMVGFFELELIVHGCTHAATHYEMPAAWRTCLIKQGYQDMEHAASYLTRGCRMNNQDYWQSLGGSSYRQGIDRLYPLLERDLGGFFALIGLHTEAYPAETNILDAFMFDPVIAHWLPHEIEEEAGHLSFLYPAMRTYLHSGAPEEQAHKKRQMVADDQMLQEVFVQNMFKKMAAEWMVGDLGVDAAELAVYERIPERTRYIYRTIGIEEEYWPAYLKQSL